MPLSLFPLSPGAQMMQNLLLTEGSIVTLRNVSIPKGKYVKLQPHTKDFIEISDPKAVLERSLRNYSCLTVGDCILIHYNNKRYYIDIVDAKPDRAISVIETDCEVDFAPPLDWVDEPKPAAAAPAASQQGGVPGIKFGKGATSGAAAAAKEEPEAEPSKPSFAAFTGAGRRLDGKPSAASPGAAGPSQPVAVPSRCAGGIHLASAAHLAQHARSASTGPQEEARAPRPHPPASPGPSRPERWSSGAAGQGLRGQVRGRHRGPSPKPSSPRTRARRRRRTRNSRPSLERPTASSRCPLALAPPPHLDSHEVLRYIYTTSCTSY